MSNLPSRDTWQMRARKFAPPLISICATLTLTACLSGPLRDVRPYSWDSEHGPVVPHTNFPGDCSLCHLGEDWQNVREDFSFDHEAQTGVALEGAHATAQCLRCHNDRGPVESFARRGCAGCHVDPHQGAVGDDCSLCHGELHWQPQGQFALHAQTRFPLIGAHTAVACWECHEGAEVGNFGQADARCDSCHQQDLERATLPDHLALGWTRDCERCHRPTSWGQGGFVHALFPLSGAHAALDCTACHDQGIYRGLPHDCAACHTDDFMATTDPDHQAENFPTNCELCHNTSGWEGALFSHAGISSGCVNCHQEDYDGAPDHIAQSFPTNCEQCHVTASWDAMFSHTGITSGCINCHQANYNSAPDHASLGFPTNCEQCHNTSNWDSPFVHTFDIDGGDHGSLNCNECHVQPGMIQVISCIQCHEHRQSEMDSEHNGVNNYSWTTPACLQCHPDGHE